jgi:large subunit ribosomal protein L9
MKVILREMMEPLGTVGDEVTVANGYARNYLLPQKKAVLATPANRNLIKRERKQLELRQGRGSRQEDPRGCVHHFGKSL